MILLYQPQNPVSPQKKNMCYDSLRLGDINLGGSMKIVDFCLLTNHSWILSTHIFLMGQLWVSCGYRQQFKSWWEKVFGNPCVMFFGMRWNRQQSWWQLFKRETMIIWSSWKHTRKSRWWFEISFIFTPTWGNDPIWLIFLKWVETTHQPEVIHTHTFVLVGNIDWQIVELIQTLVTCRVWGARCLYWEDGFCLHRCLGVSGFPQGIHNSKYPDI